MSCCFQLPVFLTHDEQLRNVTQNKIIRSFYLSMWFSANLFKLSSLRMKILLVCFAGKHLLCLFIRYWKNLEVTGKDSGPFTYACFSTEFLGVQLFFRDLPLTSGCKIRKGTCWQEWIYTHPEEIIMLFSEWAILMHIFSVYPNNSR